jgi:1-acyl-sn-glycerol-3-phosphate acyltransferase
MLRWLYSRILFDILGWRIDGNFPELSKFLVIVAPHTSNWDFPIGVFCRRILGFKSQYVAKKELFVFPLGYFFRALGGHPVERSRNTNFVDEVVRLYRENDQFVITMTPEGTRSRNDNWKSGYYHIAKAANVPVVYVGFDWGSKTVFIRKEKKGL